MFRLNLRRPTSVTIGMGGHVRYTWEFTENGRPYYLANDDVSKIANNGLYLFVYGVTAYRDIFGREHHTRWFWYMPDPNDPEPGSRMCNTWNTAD